MIAWVATVPGFVREAERMLREPDLFNWSTVTLLTLVVYVYAVEIERREWDIVLAGLAFWLMDWANEVVNALFLHFGDAPLWTATGDTSFLILIGLPVEVSLFFAVNGVIFAKLLRTVPNRWALAVALSTVSVAVELLLNADGVFHWHYWWWNAATFPVIIVFGYLTFYVVAFRVHDMRDRSRQLRTVGALATLDALALLVFGVILEWI